jgi:hypothetical protein
MFCSETENDVVVLNLAIFFTHQIKTIANINFANLQHMKVDILFLG